MFVGIAADKPRVKGFDVLVQPTYELGNGLPTNEYRLASSRRVQESEVEHRGTHATREVHHQLRADLRDRGVGVLHIVEFELPLRMHIEPVEDILPKIEHKREEDTILAVQRELQFDGARVEMPPGRIIAQHQPREASLEKTEWHAGIVVHDHNGVADTACERSITMEVNELGRTIGPGPVAQITRALSD